MAQRRSALESPEDAMNQLDEENYSLRMQVTKLQLVMKQRDQGVEFDQRLLQSEDVVAELQAGEHFCVFTSATSTNRY